MQRMQLWANNPKDRKILNECKTMPKMYFKQKQSHFIFNKLKILSFSSYCNYAFFIAKDLNLHRYSIYNTWRSRDWLGITVYGCVLIADYSCYFLDIFISFTRLLKNSAQMINSWNRFREFVIYNYIRKRLWLRKALLVAKLWTADRDAVYHMF